MLCLVLLLLIPLCFANDEISNDEVSGLINKLRTPDFFFVVIGRKLIACNYL